MKTATKTHAMKADGMPTARPITVLYGSVVEGITEQLAAKKNANIAQSVLNKFPLHSLLRAQLNTNVAIGFLHALLYGIMVAEFQKWVKIIRHQLKLFVT